MNHPKIDLRLGVKFYFLKNDKVAEEIVASGISLSDARALQETHPLFLQWSPAAEYLALSLEEKKRIFKLLDDDGTRLVDIAADVISYGDRDTLTEVMKPVYAVSREAVWDEIHLPDEASFIDALNGDTHGSFKEQVKVGQCASKHLVNYLEGISADQLIAFIRKHYDSDFMKPQRTSAY